MGRGLLRSIKLNYFICTQILKIKSSKFTISPQVTSFYKTFNKIEIISGSLVFKAAIIIKNYNLISLWLFENYKDNL
jgi:hypothetical protein